MTARAPGCFSTSAARTRRALRSGLRAAWHPHLRKYEDAQVASASAQATLLNFSPSMRRRRVTEAARAHERPCPPTAHAAQRASETPPMAGPPWVLGAGGFCSTWGLCLLISRMGLAADKGIPQSYALTHGARLERSESSMSLPVSLPSSLFRPRASPLNSPPPQRQLPIALSKLAHRADLVPCHETKQFKTWRTELLSATRLQLAGRLLRN